MLTPMTRRKISARLTRKGALIEETFMAFRDWDLSVPIRENLEAIRNENRIGAKNDGWLREILATISSRFAAPEDLEPLVILAGGGMNLAEWKICYLWHIGNTDELYYRFATDWLMEQYKKGVYFIQSKDLAPFVRQITDGRIASGGRLSDYGVQRTARDLLKMACDFGLLEGKFKKTFVNFHMPENAFLYVLHALFEEKNSPGKMISSRRWRLFFMEPEDVERELLRLHQYKIVEYQAAGSLISLKPPCATLTDYARKLTA